jgi:aspartate racemase
VTATNTMPWGGGALAPPRAPPIIHTPPPTALQVREKNIRRVGLLGTRFTMEQTFYRGRLQELHGIDVVTPVSADRDIVHRIIYDELCLGNIRDASRDEYRRIISDLEQQGAQGIIFGCTEIGLLVSERDASVPVFDTTAIHARAAAAFALD